MFIFSCQNAPENAFRVFSLNFTISESFHLLFTRSFVIFELTSCVVQRDVRLAEMLTVKKFGAVFNLPAGGYAAGIVGIILALLAIIVFPPDMDLQGKFC